MKNCKPLAKNQNSLAMARAEKLNVSYFTGMVTYRPHFTTSKRGRVTSVLRTITCFRVITVVTMVIPMVTVNFGDLAVTPFG